MSELKPCPFCGSTDLEIDDVPGTDAYGVICCGCGISMVPTAFDKECAIEEWNRRVSE